MSRIFTLDDTIAVAHHQNTWQGGEAAKPSDDTFCAAFRPVGDVLAYGGLEGSIHLLNTAQHPFKETAVLNNAKADGVAMLSALAAVAWHPKNPSMIAAASADGGITHWHTSTQKVVHSMFEQAYDQTDIEPIPDKKNGLSCLSFSPSGARFATGGKDGMVRIYDEHTLKLSDVLHRGYDSRIRIAHTMTVTSAKWIDEHIVVTGGWNDQLQVWDVREKHAIRSIPGPELSGDSLDIHVDGRTIVTGSGRPHHQLQLYDLGTGKLLYDVPWPHEPRQATTDGEFIATTCLAAKCSPNGKYVAAGGDKDFRVFNFADLASGKFSNAVVGELQGGGGSESAVFGVAWSPDCEHIAVCGGRTMLLSTAKGKRS